MNDQHAEKLIQQLEKISLALEAIARAGTPAEPNYVKPLGDYREFDWESIGASVVQSDADGPTHLEWGGALWTRRSPANKFDPAIWYSRAAGKDDEGNNRYLRLITFRPMKDAEPVPDKVVAAAGKEQPGRTPTGKTGPLGSKPLAWTEFEAQATGWKLHPQAAARIAALHGLEPKSADLSKAVPTLQYFAKAKKLGLDWAASLSILQESVMDPEQAGRVLDEQHTPPGKLAG